MYEITTDHSGLCVAVDPRTGGSIAVLPDGDHRMFQRRAIKKHPDGSEEQITWLVTELDGVRCYFDGQHAVMTRRNVYP